MVLDWFGGRSNDVADLISRKKYGKAIEVMRAQFKQRPPNIETRLQFVDVLILAGRGKEAVPVLIGLADELTTDGEGGRAIGLLKRIESIEPGREDVEERLAALVKKEFEASSDSKWQSAGPAPALKKPAPPSSKAPAPQRIAFDLEEIPDDEISADAVVPDEPAEAAPTLEMVEDAEPTQPESAAPEPEQPGTTPETGGDPTVTHQIRGAFRKFLSELPGGEPGGAAAAESEPLVQVEPDDATPLDAQPESTLELPAETPLELTAEPAAEPASEPAASEPELQLTAEPQPEPAPTTTMEVALEPGVDAEQAPTMEVVLEAQPVEAPPVEAPPLEPSPLEPPTEPEPQMEAEAAPLPLVEETNPIAADEPSPPVAAAEAETAPEPALAIEEDDGPEAMSEATFQGQVLDLIEEVVQQPMAAAAPGPDQPTPDERPVKTRGVAESAQRLVASPLFRELTEAELLAVVRGMKLHTFEAGDIVMTEGERGESLMIVTSGGVRMFVRNPAGHNFEMGVLREGDFFGELSSLSGRPRGSTVVATGHTELLELAKKTVDQIARTHPRVREALENVYIQRASSPEAAAIRAMSVDPGSHQRAIEVLEAYFGESRWDPRMRLRLADLLVKAGKEEDAVPLLVGLADDLDRAGYPEKAIAILKKIEKLRKRGTQEVNLAPLKKKKPGGTLEAIVALPEKKAAAREASAQAKAKAASREQTVDSFGSWMVDVVRDAVAPATQTGPLPPSLAPGYAKGLLASPLFEGLSEDELYTLIRELRLLSFDPGDIVITEGEPGQSLFILTAGSVKVSVRDVQGRNVRVTELRAGSFFGEMATVSGKPRTATVTAGQRCELLELDKPAIDQIAARHPRVREVLEEIYIARAGSPDTARARAGAPPP